MTSASTMDIPVERPENACFFPILNTKSVKDNKSTRSEVALPLPTFEAHFANSREHEALLQLAWHVVLRTYTGSDHPAFYYESSGETVKRPSKPQAGHISSIDLTGNQEIPHLLRRLGKADTGATSATAQSVNTVLHVGSPDKISTSLTDFSLVLTITPESDRWTAVLSAAANLLSRDQALCVADAFVHVVSQVPTASHLSSINWHAPRNLQQLEHWNMEEPEEVQECIHDMILSHARKSPGTPAICSWDGDLTYGQLDELSSKIANWLVVAETIPDTFVGLYFEKSKWTTVAMLAILRAGGAYVFLDPSFPKDRLRKICRQSQVHIVLSSGHLQEQATALDLPVVPIDENSLQTMPTGMPPSVSVQPHHAAYVSFTSGSSGDPKGAVINHSSFMSGQRLFLDFVQLGPGSRVLQFASYAFDASIWEHLASLIVGGCLCVPSEAARQSNLANAINQMKANFLIITPTVARLLRPAEVPCVQTVLLMGEPPSSSDVTTWVDHCRLINGYGPCECSCFSNVRDLVPEDHTQPTLIGRGVGARCWVTDPADIDRLLPVGAIGELVIEGPIVGRGYIGDAEIHNASFIHAPSWRKQVIPSSHHTKMYRTGDLVQYVSGGELRCLGRKDAQAKLRGQRLEMGEVEKHLHEAFDDDIQAALVDIVVPEKGQPVLVGFIQLVNRQTMYEKNIFAEPRSFFQLKAQAALSKMIDRLPSYMVPSTIVELATLPMTKTGKTDRRSLKMECGKLTRSQLDAFTRQAVEKRLPDSHMEHVLAKLISRVLHLEDDFGMNDNFFHLGGDSALVMELIRLAREEGDVEISAQNVFQYPVLSNLALTMKLVPEETQRDRDIPAFSLLNHHISEEDALESASIICGLSSKDEIEDIYPCTPTQEAMMAGTMASATEATYVIRTVYRLPRHINTAQLENAWALVQSSNALLRTRIIHHGDQALQVVLRGGFTWDWSDKLSEAVTVDSQQRMGPGKPLFRVRMIHETDTRRYMMLTIHHALCDGWSLHKTLAQVEAAYYHEIPTSWPFKFFVDHVMRSNQEGLQTFWKERLKGFSGPHFPTLPSGSSHDYRPTKIQTTTRCIDNVRHPTGINTTVATLVQLSWALVLSQYGSTDDVVFGSTVSGRNAAVQGIAEVLGPTLATIPLRIVLSPKTRVCDVLQELHDLNAQAIPFEQVGLQRISMLGSSAATACRFQSLLVIQAPQADDSAALSIFGNQDKEHSKEIVGGHIITLEAALGRDKSVHLVAEHDAHLISADFMAHLLRQLEHNLDQITRDPSLQLGALVQTTTCDMRMLHMWNSHIPEAIDMCIHDALRRRALARPSAPAVNAWDGSLTYKELDHLSTRLAPQLQPAGPGAFILIHAGKSLWSAVAILAVLKAGAAFVLVDPAQPISRLRQICNDTGAGLVIASAQYQSEASALGISVLTLTPDIMDEDGPSSLCKESPVTPRDIAYAVFTSGSTGRPKGVLISHRAFLTSAVINGGKQHIDDQSRVIQLASYTFDAAIAEFLYTLVQGGCVCIPSEAESRNNLERSINDYGVTWATLTPSLARALDPAKMTTLNTLALGGEAMTKVDIDMWAKHVRLGNGYGPTESSVDAVIQPVVRPGADPSNIGRSYAGATWIVDPANHDRRLPVGAIGELLLEGPTLANGYLNDPDKTSASFIPSPEWLTELRHGRPAPLYKTGDLAQYDTKLMDGSIKYLGRKDNQVKIRGQRIELAEVEHHVWECVNGAKAVIAEVITPSDDGAEPLLAAFILLESLSTRDISVTDQYLTITDSSSWSAVREAETQLRHRVPSYMIPAMFLPLSRVPVNANGKVDRRLLKDVASGHTRRELRAFTSSSSVSSQCVPQTAEELVLHQSLSKLLRIPPSELEMDDQFFFVGGNSILAMKLVAIVRDLGYSLTVADIFTHPRLMDLACHLHKHSKSGREVLPLAAFSLISENTRDDVISYVAAQCGVEPTMIEDLYPSTPMQAALLASTLKQEGSYIADICLDVRSDTDISMLKSAWATVYENNAILRTRLALGPSREVLQVVVKEPLIWTSARDHLDVAHGKPLLSMAIDYEQRVVRLRIHHALYDAASLSYLFDQVAAAYRGEQIPRGHFSHFAEFTSGLDIGQCATFWKEEFSEADEITTFPPQQRTKWCDLQTNRHVLSRKFDGAGSAKCNFTIPTMIYLAAGLVFGHYVQSRDVVYGLTLAGNNADSGNLGTIVGPTVTTIPFRVKLDPAESVSQNLSQVQQHLLRIAPYEQTGLKNISAASSNAAEACDFNSLLVIQPADELLESVQKAPFIERETSDDQSIAFASYPLVLVYSLSSDRKTHKITATADSLYLTEGDLANLLDQLNHVLHQVIQNQDASLGHIEVISPRDISQLARLNSTVPAPVDRLIHELVFSNSALHPQKPAITSWDGTLTYGELHQKSRMLSNYLLSTSIPQQNITVICMEKSCWTIVAILAVLRTGSACAVVDSSHPPERIREIVHQTECVQVLVSPNTKHIPPPATACIIVSEDLVHSSAASNGTIGNERRQINPADPALIFFTSGSTGKPKGMVLSHQAISTSLHHLQPLYNINEDLRVLHFVSYAFDIAMFEVLQALTTGGCLCIPSDLERTTGLTDFIRKQRVNFSALATSGTRLLQHPSEVPTLKMLMLGGEPLTLNDVALWSGSLRLIHGYAPAECSFVCAGSHLDPACQWTPGTIGPGITGCCWITDPSDPRKLVAWGAVGELLIEGHILATEYIGNPGMTEASFVQNPPWLARFRQDIDKKTRFYRTGDLVHYTAEGEIRFVGRKDSQIKLRGQRIELGEIESHVQSNLPPGCTVIAGIVPARSASQGHNLYVFIYTGDDNTPEGPPHEDGQPFFLPSDDVSFADMCSKVAARLSEVLPRYMLPHEYVRLRFIPETGSGKIDRRLLVKLASSTEAIGVNATSAKSSNHFSPTTEVERALATIWSEELQVPVSKLSLSDNFFHLGGDSIHAMKLAGASRRHGFHLSVPDIFSSPLLGDMALLASKRATSLPHQDVKPFTLLPEDIIGDIRRAAAEQCNVQQASIEDIYSCTPFQEGLISQSLRKGAGAFVGSFRFQLPSTIDVQRLHHAWQETARTSSILRTRIIQHQASLFQAVILEDIPLSVVEESGHVEVLNVNPFDFGQRLLELTLVNKRDGYEFHILIHHAIYDGWSIDLLLDQVASSYRGEKINRPPYTRLVQHISDNHSSAKTYWQTHLSGAASNVFPRLPSSTYEPVTNSVVQQTVALNMAQGVTAATTLQLAWAIVLSQLTDTDDVVYGLILSGRSAGLEGIESLVGPTVTTVPLRVNLQRDHVVESQLQRLQKQVNELLSHQQFGMRNIKSIGGDAEAACAFQNLLLIQPAASARTEKSEDYLWMNPIQEERNAGDFSTYALEVTCEVSKDSANIIFDFDDAVLDERQARRILHQYCHIIEEIHRSAGAQMSTLDLLSAQSQKEIREWNAHLPKAVEKCIHDGIKEQCEDTPDAVAVCAWDGDLTYGELDYLSHTLAIYLRARGVRPESFVPVLMEKSKWVAVAILGVVRAGGAVVLLDPSVPFERLRTICQTVEASLIVAGNQTCRDVAQQLVAVVVEVGHKESPAYRMNGVTDLPPIVGPGNALYAIFTSGSTGKPKGIVTEHRAFYTSGLAQQRPLRINKEMRTLQFASHMFDVSVADYLWTFLAGGCVCVPSQDMLKDDLTGAINQLKVNRADLTPSIARVLRHEDIPTVRTLLLGGEAMSQHDIESWAGRVDLVNGYGPSECSVCCILADVDVQSSPSTIGHAYGIVPWIVDKDNHQILMPIGGIGELVLEGHSLARGYLGDAGRAAASAFIEEEPQWLRGMRDGRSRLYKTGDLAQYNSDGTIKYIGRKDTQIKIRGQRVELEEIEQQIRHTDASLQDVTVELLTPGDQATDKMLAAFIRNMDSTGSSAASSANGHSASLFHLPHETYRRVSERIASNLEQILPSYMIPTLFIPLIALPLTPTGKADRRRLREEAMLMPLSILRQYQAGLTQRLSPRTDAERRLRAVVAEVLRRTEEDIGMNDEFFRLGGDSIIALHFVQRARQCGFSFQVTTVFKTPKLADLATHSSEVTAGHGIEESVTDIFEKFGLPNDQEISGIKNSWPSCGNCKVTDVIPVSQSTERFLQVAPEYWILNLEGHVNIAQLQSACDSLVQRHSVLRSVFSKHGGRFVQIVLDNIPTNIVRLNMSTATIFDSVEQYRVTDSIPVPTLDIPVTQFLFFGAADGSQALVLRLSHAQFDGYCLHTIWHDLKCLYEGSHLPEPTDYALHMQTWAKSQTDEAFEYWRQVLEGSNISRISNATIDRAYTNGFHRVRGDFVTVTRRVGLPTTCPEGITLATVVKAAWAITLSRLTHQNDVVFTQAVNGRSNSTECKEVVGLCLNFSPVRVDLQSLQTGLELLDIIQKQHQQSMDYELLDFRDIVQRSTTWPEGTSHQSMLVHQNIDPDLPFTFGESRAHVTCSYHWEHPPDDILIESRPTEDGTELQVTMDTTSETLMPENANVVLGELCQWIAVFLNRPEDDLAFGDQIS